ADPADLDLDDVGVLPGDPLGDGAGSAGRRRHDLAGLPEGDRAAGRTRGLHHGDHRVLHRLERLHLRDLADLDRGGPAGAGGPRPLHRSLAVRGADRRHLGGGGHRHDPGGPAGAHLPAADRRRSHQRRGQGL
ncbi:MAG: ABC transporter, permease protein 2 (cluster 1, maltose/g3p/polyamine/iron), partial [uncultured Blastococcus sp.]